MTPYAKGGGVRGGASDGPIDGADPAVPSPLIWTSIFEPGAVRAYAVAMYLLLVLTVIADFFSEYTTIDWFSYFLSFRDELLTV